MDSAVDWKASGPVGKLLVVVVVALLLLRRRRRRSYPVDDVACVNAGYALQKHSHQTLHFSFGEGPSHVAHHLIEQQALGIIIIIIIMVARQRIIANCL